MATTQRTYDLDASSLKVSLRGDLIQPGDEGYDDARKVYNAMIDRRPRLIARCADVADVITAVNFARENKVLVSRVTHEEYPEPISMTWRGRVCRSML